MLNHRVLSKLSVLVVGVCMLLLVGGCEKQTPKAKGKPVVVTSIQPLHSIAKQLGGDDFEVVCIVPGGVSPHGFEMPTGTMKQIKQADIVVVVGMGFDEFATTALDKSHNHHAVLIEMAVVNGVAGPTKMHDHHDHGDEHDHAHEHEKEGEGKDAGASGDAHGHDHGHDHDHSGPDPHLWLDVSMMKKLVGEVGRAMVKLKPEQKNEINRRVAKLVTELEGLDAEMKAALSEVPHKKLITFHDAWSRLAKGYGLEVSTTLTPPNASSGPVPKRILEAIKAIKEQEIKAVFIEPQFPADHAKSIADETGIKVLTLDPLGDANHAETDTYQKMMRYNLKMLLAGLKGE